MLGVIAFVAMFLVGWFAVELGKRIERRRTGMPYKLICDIEQCGFSLSSRTQNGLEYLKPIMADHLEHKHEVRQI